MRVQAAVKHGEPPWPRWMGMAEPRQPHATTNEGSSIPKTRSPRGAGVRKRAAAAIEPPARIVVPVRYAAWLNGDIGRLLERDLQQRLDDVPDAKVTRLPRAFLVEAHEAPGPLLEAVHRAATGLERGAATAYPVFHHELGPVWTGTLQSVFV